MLRALTLLLFAVCACFSKPVSIPRPAPPPSTPPPTTPVPPVFELDLWPGEGIPVVHPVRSELALRGAASLSAPVATVVRVPLNTPLQYDTTRYQTIRPGRVRVLTSAKVLGRDFGDIRRLSSEAYYRGGARPASLDVAPTTIFDYLQYRAEGTCFVRIEGRVVDADPCPVQDKTAFRLESDPRLLWWIHVRTANGAGWLVLSDTTVREVSRTF